MILFYFFEAYTSDICVGMLSVTFRNLNRVLLHIIHGTVKNASKFEICSVRHKVFTYDLVFCFSSSLNSPSGKQSMQNNLVEMNR